MSEFQKAVEMRKQWLLVADGSLSDHMKELFAEFLEIIESAKKEFPIELMDLDLNPNYFRIYKWFKKWFGKGEVRRLLTEEL